MMILTLPHISLMMVLSRKEFLEDLYFILPVFHDSQSQLCPQIWLQSCPQRVPDWRLLNRCHSCSWHLVYVKWQMAMISTSYIQHLERETCQFTVLWILLNTKDSADKIHSLEQLFKSNLQQTIEKTQKAQQVKKLNCISDQKEARKQNMFDYKMKGITPVEQKILKEKVI